MSVVFSPSLVITPIDPDAPDLTHARIGYAKHSGTITASTAAGGFPATAADNALTYSFWKPLALPATWEIDYGEIKAIDYVGIAAHEFDVNGNTVALQVWNGSAWVSIASTSPTDNSPLVFIFDELTVSKVRLSITGGAAPRVGVIYTGTALVMERAIYDGHSPINLSSVTGYTTNISESGQWLGRSVKSQGMATSYQWSNLTAVWYREYFQPFVLSAKTQPFFIAWRPETFPDETAYCWTRQDIKPTNSGGRDLMSVTLNAEGLA
jgi:hypothetical protein